MSDDREFEAMRALLALEEVDQRMSQGLEVTLLRNPNRRQLTVVTVDEAENQVFALEAEPEEAVEVFQHPYAYLHHRRPLFRRGDSNPNSHPGLPDAA